MSENKFDNINNLDIMTDTFDEKKLLEDIKLQIDQYLKESYQSVLEDLNNGNLKMINYSLPNKDINSQQLGRVSKSRSKTRSKTRSKSKNILPPISKSKEDSLSKYGYRLSKSPLARKRALKKAARSRGTLTVLKRVNLIGNYSKSIPINYDKLRADVEYLKDEYAKEKLEKIRAIYAPKSSKTSKTSKSSKSKRLPKIKANFVF